jgi:hypothetical protein
MEIDDDDGGVTATTAAPFGFNNRQFSDICLVVEVEQHEGDDEKEEEEKTDESPAKRRRREGNVVVDKRIFASRQRLGERSLFFRALLQRKEGVAWHDSNREEVTVFLRSETERPYFLDLLRSFYGAPLRVRDEQALRTFHALADRFVVNGMSDALAEVLEEDPCTEVGMLNALFAMEASSADGMEKLHALRTARLFQQYSDFNDEGIHADVLRLDAEPFAALLASSLVCVASENVVWSLVAKWLVANEDRRSRGDVRARLLGLVRYTALQPIFWAEVVMASDLLMDVPRQMRCAATRVLVAQVDPVKWDGVVDVEPRTIVSHTVVHTVVVDVSRKVTGRKCLASNTFVINGYGLQFCVLRRASAGNLDVFLRTSPQHACCLEFKEVVFEIQRRDGVWRTLLRAAPYVWARPQHDSGVANAVKKEQLVDPAFECRLPGDILVFRCSVTA